ncbi:TauD/TfdA family dioxygenase [Streptomyces sp. NPDC055796]
MTMTVADILGTRPDSGSTLAVWDLPDSVREAVGRDLARLADPAADLDWATARCHQVFAQLPTELLRRLLDFGRHPDTPGVALVGNLPQDALLPPTPLDGGPCPAKGTFVAEGVLLGLSGLLGEPVGMLSEKDGRIVHDVVPVPGGEHTQTNQGSRAFLNFHSDIVHDPAGRYDLANPDFLVLNCLRADHDGEAVTYYADARDIAASLGDDVLTTLRSPLFRLNAPGGYTRAHAGGREVLSDPVPLIGGAAAFPEITVAANGVRPMTTAAGTALLRLQEVCRSVAQPVRLRPGQALLVNNRKGVHARSVFTPRYDGLDRWVQRTYVRRSLWTIRHRASPTARRVHL